MVGEAFGRPVTVDGTFVIGSLAAGGYTLQVRRGAEFGRAGGQPGEQWHGTD